MRTSSKLTPYKIHVNQIDICLFMFYFFHVKSNKNLNIKISTELYFCGDFCFVPIYWNKSYILSYFASRKIFSDSLSACVS